MRQHRLVFGLLGLIALTGTGIGLAVSAVTSSTPPATEFLCADGERLLLSKLGDSVRVRTGSGIFQLQAAEGQQLYQSQFMQVDLGPEALELTRPEQRVTQRCKAINDQT